MGHVLARSVLTMAVFLTALVLVDLLGGAVAALTGSFGSGGLLAQAPPPLGHMLSPPPAAMATPIGLALLGFLTVALAVSLYGATRSGASRLGALALLLALALPLMVWHPPALGIIGLQALLLAFSSGSSRGDAFAQVVRLIGLVLVVLITWTTPSALVVSLIAVALAPSALLAVSIPSSASAETAAEAMTFAPTEALDRAGEPAIEQDLVPDRVASPDPSTGVATLDPATLEPVTLGAPDSGLAQPPQVDQDSRPEPGVFGHDPVAALAHLTPASALVERARTALIEESEASPPLLAMVRLDGLAGIAEHLDVGGGEALFAEATARLDQALPPGSMLSWLGDETFAALMVATASEDLDHVVAALATPFASEILVNGRPVSMEDAFHADVVVLDPEILEELTRWARSAPE